MITSSFTPKREQSAPSLDASAAGEFGNAAAALALAEPLDAEQVRVRDAAQVAAPACEPQAQSATPDRRRRCRERRDAQRPRACVTHPGLFSLRRRVRPRA